MGQSFDLLGDIALVNFPRDVTLTEKKKIAKKIMGANRSIKTVLEKSGKIKGRLRKPETKYILGEKNKEVLYKENGCVFRFHIDDTYFSPRLSNERKEIAAAVKRGERVFVCCAGVAPFSIVIAKHSKAREVVSNELNRVANQYGRQNAQLNKVSDTVVFWDGDVKRMCEKHKREKFDVIVMPRPQLKDTFLPDVLKLAKKGTRVYYYDFCAVEDREKVVLLVKEEAARAGKKIRIRRVKDAGEIAPYRVRLRVDFVVQ